MKKTYKIIAILSLGLFIVAGAGFYAWARNESVATKKTVVENSLATAIVKKPSTVPAQGLPVVQNVPKPEEPKKDATDKPKDTAPPAVIEDTGPQKLIDVDLSEQKLRYFNPDGTEVGSFLISSGVKWMPTPKGTFKVLKKVPVVLYEGPDYYLPNTKWNLRFLPHYYIHGAYWHNNFGQPMSHGCVNVSYANMEGLYNWADEGTKIVIHD